MIVPPIHPEQLALLAMRCPACGWKGKGSEAINIPDSALICPRCRLAYRLVEHDPDAHDPSKVPPL